MRGDHFTLRPQKAVLTISSTQCAGAELTLPQRVWPFMRDFITSARADGSNAKPVRHRVGRAAPAAHCATERCTFPPRLKAPHLKKMWLRSNTANNASRSQNWARARGYEQPVFTIHPPAPASKRRKEAAGENRVAQRHLRRRAPPRLRRPETSLAGASLDLANLDRLL